MFEIFKEKSKVNVVQLIHEEFDSTSARLLAEAREILNRPIPVFVNLENKVEQRAIRLRSLGFENAPDVIKEYGRQQKIATIEEQMKIKTEEYTRQKAAASVIETYNTRYPFLKFITEEELDRICAKFGLIYAPVSKFKGEVPEKNLIEIENAKSVITQDLASNRYFYKPTDLRGQERILRKFFKKNPEVEIESDAVNTYASHISPDRRFMYKSLKKYGIEDPMYTSFPDMPCEIRVEDRQKGLFIAATPDNFILDKGKKTSTFGYSEFSTYKYDDPIVFRYCKDGIQVITKWGLEASDPVLVNQIEN